MKYDYRPPYVERDSNIKIRKCKKCLEFKKTEKLETKSICKICYIKERGKKRCNKCHIRKEVHYFYKNNSNNDGYCSKCKGCVQKPSKNKQKQYSKKYLEKLKKDNNL